jgi:hypothetical protein
MKALTRDARTQRDILLTDVAALVKRGHLEAAVLRELNHSRSAKGIAFDLLALSIVLRKHAQTHATRTGLGTSDIDAAELVAQELIVALGKRNKAPAELAQVTRDRQAVFTLLVNAYGDARAAVAYLRRKQGDVDSIAPSLYAGRNTKKKAIDLKTAKARVLEPGGNTSGPSGTRAPVEASLAPERWPPMDGGERFA